MRRRATRFVLPLCGAAAIYSAYSWRQFRDKKQNTFTIPVKRRSEDGSIITKEHTITRLSQEEVERKLNTYAASYSIPRSDAGRWRYETASLPSNDPIEDTHAEVIIRPGEPGSELPVKGRKSAKTMSAPKWASDTLFFAIMDGHSGFHTSRLLSKTLIPAVALELSTLSAPVAARNGFQGWMAYFKSFIPFTSSSLPSLPRPSYPFASDPTYVKTAIQTAFANLDSQIINAPMAHVNALALPLDKTSDAYQLALINLLPALSGSCALLAVLEWAREDLYVACTGDSRAVGGYRVPGIQGNKWEADVLSEDQTGRNPNEHKRIQSEHPADEAAAVIQRGRVFGGLEPTRAFGDARYKWPKDFQERAATLFNVEGSGLSTPVRAPPNDLKTPPYVTSRPEVTHRKVSFSPVAAPSSTTATGNPPIQFIVLATDGLWDKLSSSSVVELVGGYLDRRHRAPTPHATQEDGWSYTDTNVATHLIRNALTGNTLRDGNRAPGAKGFAEVMSIPAPHSRRYRDDITVTVVWWEDSAQETTIEQSPAA